MNLASAVLVLFGFLMIILGVVSKIIGYSLLFPYIQSPVTFLIIAIACFVLSLVIDKFNTK